MLWRDYSSSMLQVFSENALLLHLEDVPLAMTEYLCISAEW
jgi:hypothetical protein